MKHLIRADAATLFISIKGLLIAMSASLLVSGCSIYSELGDTTLASHQADCREFIIQQMNNQEALDRQLNNRIETFADLVTAVHATREDIQFIVSELRPAISADKPLPPQLLEQLQKTYQSAIRFFDYLDQFGLEQSCWLSLANHPELKKELILKGSTLYIATGTAIYDNYRQVYSLLSENNKIRRFLDKGDSGYGAEADQLQIISDRLLNIPTLKNLREHIDFFQENGSVIRQMTLNDQHMAHLVSYIHSTATWEGMITAGPIDIVSKRINIGTNQVADNLASIQRQSIGGISEVFGNAVGSYASRTGKLYHNQEVHSAILATLQPGDILLEKTPFRLTDTFIPGHWGHAAIWVGNQNELEKANIWQHPAVIPHHDQLVSNKSIVEALRDGVQLNTLSHFMNIDDILVLRVNDLAQGEKTRTIIRAFRQLGKAYDFNFDVDSTDEIVCSELIYVAYNSISFATDKLAGRFTISPDNVAAKVFDGTMEIVTFYHDGMLVEKNQEQLLRYLMQPTGTE